MLTFASPPPVPVSFAKRLGDALSELGLRNPDLEHINEEAVVGALHVQLHNAFEDLYDPARLGPFVWDTEYMRNGLVPKRFRPTEDESEDLADTRRFMPALPARRACFPTGPSWPS